MDGELFLKDVVERAPDQSALVTLRPIGAKVGMSFPQMKPKKDYSRLHSESTFTASNPEAIQSVHQAATAPRSSLESFRVPVDPASSAGLSGPVDGAISAESLQKLEAFIDSKASTIKKKDVIAALESSIAQHRLLGLRALETLFASQSELRRDFYYDERLAACVTRELTASQPVVVCLALELLQSLLQSASEELFTEIYSEIGVPLADVNEDSSDLPAKDDENNDDAEQENVAAQKQPWTRDQASKLLTNPRVGAPQKLLIAYPSVLECAKLPQEGQANASSERYLAAFWCCLAHCVTKATVMVIVSDPVGIAALQHTLQRVLLGKSIMDEPQHSTCVNHSAFSSCMVFLRTVFHHKDACMKLLALPSVRTSLLSLSHLFVDAAGSIHLPASKSSIEEAPPLRWPFFVEGALSYFLSLRSAVRHGCDGISREFGPQLVQSVPLGSLVTVEMVLLSAVDDITSDTQNSFMDECARAAVQLLFQLSQNSCSSGSGSSAAPVLKQIGLSTALHYLATYLSVEGARSIALFSGSAVETQTIINRLLQTAVMSVDALAAFFVRLQRHGRSLVNSTSAALPSPDEAFQLLLVRKGLAAQAAVDHGRLRLAVACVSVFPATRDGVAAFVEAVAARFVELCLACRDISAAVHPDELCAAVESVVFLSERQESLRSCAMMALVILHCIALTKHCLDAAPRIADISLRCADIEVNGDARSSLVAGLERHAAAPSPSWVEVFMELSPLQWSSWIVRSITVHSQAKYIVRSPRLLVSCVLLAAKRPGLLTVPLGEGDGGKPVVPSAMFKLVGAALSCCDDAVLPADESSRLASGVQPVLENLFGDPLPSSLAAVLCVCAACMPPKFSICLLQLLMDINRDSPIVCSEVDFATAHELLWQQSSRTKKWPLADLLDLSQRCAAWLSSTKRDASASVSFFILREVVVSLVRTALDRADIKSNDFSRIAVEESLREAGLADDFDLV